MSMLYDVCRQCRNYFPAPGGYHDGTFEIRGGKVDLPFLIPGQYFLVEGSVLNDGIYCYDSDFLQDETFAGTVTALRIPPRFLDLVRDIETWQETNGNASPYTSESFGGYSYTRATNGKGGVMSWADAFSGRLKEWRRV